MCSSIAADGNSAAAGVLEILNHRLSREWRDTNVSGNKGANKNQHNDEDDGFLVGSDAGRGRGGSSSNDLVCAGFLDDNVRGGGHGSLSAFCSQMLER